MAKFKRGLIALLAAVFLIGLTACGSQGGNVSGSGGSGGSGQSGSQSTPSASSGGGGGGGSSGSATYTIGFIGPLTGNSADLGVRPLAAIELLVEQINAAGGVKMANGQTLTLKVDSENDFGTVDGAVAAMRKLIEVKKVDAVVGGMMSSPVLANMDIAEQQGMPYIITGAIANGIGKKIAERGYKYVFQSAPTSSARAAADMQSIMDLLQPKKIYVIAQETDWGRDMAEGALSFKNEKHPELEVIVEYVPSGTTSYSSQLLKIQSEKPDVIYALLIGQELFSFMDQKYSTGDRTIVFGGSSTPASDIYVKTIGPEKADLTMMNLVWTPDVGGEAGQKFAEAYKNKTGNSPADIEAQAYDGILMLVNALENAKSTSKEDVAAALVNAQADGLRGKNVYDPVSHTTPNLSFVIGQIQNGEYVTVWPSSAAKGTIKKP